LSSAETWEAESEPWWRKLGKKKKKKKIKRMDERNLDIPSWNHGQLKYEKKSKAILCF
jgi:hypothetical protein